MTSLNCWHSAPKSDFHPTACLLNKCWLPNLLSVQRPKPFLPHKTGEQGIFQQRSLYLINATALRWCHLRTDVLPYFHGHPAKASSMPIPLMLYCCEEEVPRIKTNYRLISFFDPGSCILILESRVLNPGS